jgi:hypothetical protein
MVTLSIVVNLPCGQMSYEQRFFQKAPKDNYLDDGNRVPRFAWRVDSSGISLNA